MFRVIITAITSFVSTNIDDILVLMVLFSQATKYINVVIGQYFGMGILFCISVLGTLGVNVLPEKYVGFLGLLPILLGIRSWIASKTQKESKDESQNIGLVSKNDDTVLKTNNFMKRLVNSEILSVIAITIANGADNIGIYIPIFSGYAIFEFVITIAIFVLLTALWCYWGNKIAHYPFVKTRLQKYKNIFVPVVFMGLGVYIIIKSGIIGFKV
jgi:cadmium resistance transport/sequestration family protein